MPINSRAKGKRGEREFAELLREMGFEDASRGATQSAGAITADVVGSILFWDPKKERYRRLYAEVGETPGIEPGKRYKVESGAFVEAL